MAEDHLKMFNEEGFNCAEAVLAGATGSRQCVNLASGFGGGIGRSGSVCGAVTGAVMALGQIMGMRCEDSTATPRQLQEAVNDLLDSFRKEFGAHLCGELIPYDLSSREGLEAFRNDPEGKARCAEFVDRGVALVREITGRA